MLVVMVRNRQQSGKMVLGFHNTHCHGECRRLRLAENCVNKIAWIGEDHNESRNVLSNKSFVVILKRLQYKKFVEDFKIS